MMKKVLRKIAQIDEKQCNGCGQCVPVCAERAIWIVDGKGRLVTESYCDGLGACLTECPQGAIQIIERQAEEFHPEEVERYSMNNKKLKQAEEIHAPTGYPSSRVQMSGSPPYGIDEDTQARITSLLSHWPVKIRLVPPAAPFLKGAHLIVAADCTPVVYPSFHSHLLKDKVLLIGCPKFDDLQAYIKKFTEIFETVDIKSVTVVAIEVPCCQGLLMIIDKALESAGKNITVEEITISPTGKIIKREKY